MINFIISAYGGFGAYGIGVNFINNKELSDYISSKGYSQIKSYSLSQVGSGYFIFKNFIIGGIGFNGFSNTYQNSNKFVKTKFSGGGFSFGYIIFSTNYLLIYPTILLGGYGYSMKLYEKTTDSLSGVIDEPKREVELSIGSFMFGPYINLTYFVYGGINVSINLGYNLTLSSEFSSESVQITNNKEFSFNNFYVNVALGIGGFTK